MPRAVAPLPASGTTAGRRPRRRPWTIRPVRWNDFEDFARTYLSLYDERAAGGTHGITLSTRKPTMAQEVDWFANLYKRVLNGDAIVIVGEANGRAVGHCTVARVADGPAAEAGHQAVLGIVVEKRWRGQGIGRAMMREALRRSAKQFDVVRLGVHASNLRARHLYESLGFRPIGRIPRAVRRLGEVIDEDLMAIVFAPPRRRRPNR